MLTCDRKSEITSFGSFFAIAAEILSLRDGFCALKKSLGPWVARRFIWRDVASAATLTLKRLF